MEVIISAVKLNLLAPIGSISEKKISLLDKRFLADYPLKQIPDGKTVIYVNVQKGNSIIIGPNQISFGLENIEKSVPHIDNQAHVNTALSLWNNIATSIADDLLLDKICDVVEIDLAALVSTFKNKGKEAADNSIQRFSPIRRPALKEICDPIAVGLRYVFEREHMIHDSRIEPFLPDLSQYLYTMNIKTKENTHSFFKAFGLLEANLEFYRGPWFNLIKDSILI